MEMLEIAGGDNNEKDETTGKCETLKPGSKIKPESTTEDVMKLVERLYGITTKKIHEIVSYDDRNYIIHEDRNIKNPLIVTSWPHGYVFKIMNALDSKKLDFVSAQTDVMLFLRKQNFNCPGPVQNVYGNYFSEESINGSKHIVRLLEFIPGNIFHEVPKNNHLFYQVGEYIAKIDVALMKFPRDTYKTHKSLWMLESVPKLKEFLYVLQDHSRKEMVEQIVTAFESKVITQMHTFEKSIIHGDFNEQNIVVSPIKGGKEYRISAVLDFGDTSYSPLVFELATTMTYMILQAKDIATGGLVLAGYTSVKTLPEKELAVLRECIAGRLCQSLILGAYTHSLHPDNDYLLITQKAGWESLESLWKDNYDTVDTLWRSTADNYLKQSIK